MKDNVVSIILTVVCTTMLFFGSKLFVLTTGGSFYFLPLAILGIGLLVFLNQSHHLMDRLLGKARQLLPEDMVAPKSEAFQIASRLVKEGMSQDQALREAIRLGEIEAAKRRASEK